MSNDIVLSNSYNFSFLFQIRFPLPLQRQAQVRVMAVGTALFTLFLQSKKPAHLTKNILIAHYSLQTTNTVEQSAFHLTNNLKSKTSSKGAKL